MLDASGHDAIWIQEANSACGEGHSGLMVQDADGQWYYFFWGPQKEGFQLGILFVGVPSRFVLKEINTYGHDLTKTNEVRIAVTNSSDPFIRDRDKKITATYYFKGDYTATYNWLKEKEKEENLYQLLTDNCVQVVISAMQQSDSHFDRSFSNIPNHVEISVWFMQPFTPAVNPWSHPNATHNYSVIQ